MGRAQTGLALAGLLLTAAVLVNNCTAGSIGFVALTILVLLATVANRVPLLHRMSFVGAPTVSVVLSLEGRLPLLAGIRRRPPYPVPDEMKQVLGMDFERGPLEARSLHLQVGLQNEDRSVLRDASVTFMLPEGLKRQATDPYGDPIDQGRWMPPTSESLLDDDEGRAAFSDYWVWRGDLPPGSTLLYFRITVGSSRRVPVRIKIDAPDLYEEVIVDDVIKVTEFPAGAEPSHDQLSYAIEEAEAWRAHLRHLPPGSETDLEKTMNSIVGLAWAVPEKHAELTRFIATAPVVFAGPLTGPEYEAELLATKIRAAYDARRRLGTHVSKD